jgi:hypothetical protein
MMVDLPVRHEEDIILLEPHFEADNKVGMNSLPCIAQTKLVMERPWRHLLLTIRVRGKSMRRMSPAYGKVRQDGLDGQRHHDLI